MLYLFYGNDTAGVRGEAYDLISGKEADGQTVERIEAENFQAGMLRDAVGAVSLFGGETLYVLDMPSLNADFQTELTTLLEAVSESSTTFVVVEGPLIAADLKPYKKYAVEVREVKKVGGERFNPFGMADALARKDKKTLWLLYTEARAAGLSPEEIIGTLWWQLKTLRLAAQTNSPEEAGLKSFPYQKAKRALSNFAQGELESKSDELLSIYHDGHAGRIDLPLALEAWTLRI